MKQCSVLFCTCDKARIAQVSCDRIFSHSSTRISTTRWHVASAVTWQYCLCLPEECRRDICIAYRWHICSVVGECSLENPATNDDAHRTLCVLYMWKELWTSGVINDAATAIHSYIYEKHTRWFPLSVFVSRIRSHTTSFRLDFDKCMSSRSLCMVGRSCCQAADVLASSIRIPTLHIYYTCVVLPSRLS